jgi:hypothetical protein
MTPVEELVAERGAVYGSPAENFNNCAVLWSEWLRNVHNVTVPITGRDVAMMMVLFKVARLYAGTWHQDSVLDIAGYATCLNQMIEEGK